MPAIISTAASGAWLADIISTAGSKSIGINADPTAPNLAAVAALLWDGNVDVTGATFGISFGGTPMDDALDGDYTDITYAGGHKTLRPFTLLNPPTGNGLTVTASYSGIGEPFVTPNLTLVVATYRGVDSFGDPVVAGNSSPMNNSINLDAVAAAHRPVFIHAVGGANLITGYNQITRAHQKCAGLAGGDLLLGDAAGSDTITSTAQPLISLTAEWAAIGFDLIPAVVSIDGSMLLSPLAMDASSGLFRPGIVSGATHWEIPTEPNTYPAGFEGINSTVDPNSGCCCQ